MKLQSAKPCGAKNSDLPIKSRKVKTKKNLRQFLRYLIVGGCSFLLEYGLFFVLLQEYKVHYLIANSIVYSSVSFINFIANRALTFRSQENFKRQLTLYISLILFNFFASNLVLYILSGVLQIKPLLAKIVVMGMVVCWNFVLYKKVIYR
jgi:putative flippase GtrA